MTLFLLQESVCLEKSEMEPIKEESESPHSASPTSRIPKSPADDSRSGIEESSADVKSESADDIESLPGDKTWIF